MMMTPNQLLNCIEEVSEDDGAEEVMEDEIRPLK